MQQLLHLNSAPKMAGVVWVRGVHGAIDGPKRLTRQLNLPQQASMLEHRTAKVNEPNRTRPAIAGAVAECPRQHVVEQLHLQVVRGVRSLGGHMLGGLILHRHGRHRAE
eukprot:scaffold42954_cov74-Phaeocystis_antarctica.AAC.3